MKNSRLLWCLVMCVFPTIFIAQTYTVNDVAVLLKKAEQDSVAEIERMAALEFHKLINQYREENGLNTIKWNETLWIATQNHNLWMANTGELSHHQTTSNKYYTGNSPGDRLSYAQAGKTSFGWSGENALYNYSYSGKTKEEIAQNIAQKSFIQWKNSPGHNKNMLSKRHGSHGVAFKLNGSVVWGTDLFSYIGNEDEGINSRYHTAENKKKTVHFNPTKTLRSINTNITEEVASSQQLKVKSINNKGEAYKQARNLLAKRIKTNNNGVLMEEQSNTQTKGVLGLFAKDIDIYTLVIERELDDFNVQAVSKDLAQLIASKQIFTAKSKLDLGLALKKKKNIVRISLVSVCYNPKNKVAIF